MKGNVVITSKELVPLDMARNYFAILEDENRIGKVHPIIKADVVIWNFESESDAIFCSKKLMELGFEFVKREV